MAFALKIVHVDVDVHVKIMNEAIIFENISKQYRLGLVSTGTIAHDLNRWWTMNILRKEDPYLKIGETNDRSHKGNSEYVWALKDINFKVEQGDVVGIIGKNGAGKSTLLKLLSRVTAPTTGSIKARGRIASLLEVGTGFHPEMTGRENIYLNGAIMGMTKAEISRKLDEIVDFSGCERYIDTPVKRYSSGMTVRLGFAIAAHLDPEILVVDEVLAVGDAEFQKKAIGKMQDVSRGEGRTVLFVSHNMASVRRLCKTGVLLKDGMVEYTGAINDTIDSYLKSGIDAFESLPLSEMPRVGKCNFKAKFNNIEFLDENDNLVIPSSGKYLKIRIHFDIKEFLRNCNFSMGVYDMMGGQILSMPSIAIREDYMINIEKPFIDLILPKLPLSEGSYHLGFYFGSDRETVDFLDATVKMSVESGDYLGYGRTGYASNNGKLVLCDYNWVY